MLRGEQEKIRGAQDAVQGREGSNRVRQRRGRLADVDKAKLQSGGGSIFRTPCLLWEPVGSEVFWFFGQAAWCGAGLSQGRITWSRGFSRRAVGDGGDAVQTTTGGGCSAKGEDSEDDGRGMVWGDEGFSFWGLSAW